MSEGAYIDSVSVIPHSRWNPYQDREGIVAQICERLEKGESLTSICRDADMPAAMTVVGWQRDDEEVALQIRRAREVGEDAIADYAMRIADGLEPTEGVLNDASRDKLRVETRLKLLAKFNPKRWGDSTQLRHADADGAKLDNGPLVSEFLALLGRQEAPSATPAPPRQVVERASLLAPSSEPNAPRRPAYQPRAARVTDVSDLV